MTTKRKTSAVASARPKGRPKNGSARDQSDCEPGLVFRDTTKKCEKMPAAVEKLLAEATAVSFEADMVEYRTSARGQLLAQKAASACQNAANALYKAGFRKLALRMKADGISHERTLFPHEPEESLLFGVGYKF